MARMTLADYIRFTRRASGNPTEEDWPDSDIIRMINNAIYDIAMLYRPKYLEAQLTHTTTPDDKYVDLPSNYIAMVDGKNLTSGPNIDPITTQDEHSINQGTEQKGIVTKWYETNDSTQASGNRRIALWLTPNTAQNLEFTYIRKPAELVEESPDDFVDLPELYDNLVLRSSVEKVLSFDMQISETEKQRRIKNVESGYIPPPPSSHYVWSLQSPAARMINEGKGGRRGR